MWLVDKARLFAKAIPYYTTQQIGGAKRRRIGNTRRPWNVAENRPDDRYQGKKRPC